MKKSPNDSQPSRNVNLTLEEKLKIGLEAAGSCPDCGACLDACPTYQVTGQPLFSPPQRLKTAATIFSGGEIDEQRLESIYNCPKCRQCEAVCPEGINVTRVIHLAREELARQGRGPLKKHNRVIEGILQKGNSVNGDPATRLEWLPEKFSPAQSDTLLYLGCLPSYLVKDSALSSYLVLKKLGMDFMILEEEGCCGTYLYESGRTDLAGEFFARNAERFDSLGVKTIIVPCNGCLKCFKYFYPDLLGEVNFQVRHIVEVIFNLLKQNPQILKKASKTVTYQDSCRLGRSEGITEEPRQILERCGFELREMDKNRAEAVCCGAGGGIRSVYRDLSLEIAAGLLNSVPTDLLVSACPFCTFNLNFASQRKEIGKTTLYFTSLVLEALE